MADLPAMAPGTRFMLSDEDGRVMYRGTALPDGEAEMDVLSFRGVDPVRLTVQELYDIYDPGIHTFGTIGTAV